MRNKSLLLTVGILLTLLLTVFLAACSNEPSSSHMEGKVKVTTTIGMISDVVSEIGGEYVEVEALMGPTVDPHLFKPTQGDIRKLDEAQIIFYNGLGLEGKMADIFVQLARKKPTIAVTENISEDLLLEDPEHEGFYDPHVWFDVQLWAMAAERIRDGLIEIDPSHKEIYEKNTEAYKNKLYELDQYARERIATIPKERRVLVTAHDAFGYLGHAYDLEVFGLQGLSTDSEYSVTDVRNLVNLLVERQIKAVFVESSVSERAIEAVVQGARERGHHVVIGGELFSDAMGEADTEEGTYIGMVKHNVDTIVSALK